MASYSEEIAAACSAARAAARLCTAVQREMLGTPDRMEKAGREPVTIADYGAQAIILREIARRFPSDSAFAEERAADFMEVASDAQRQQVIGYVQTVAETSVSADDIRAWLDFGRGQTSQRVWEVDPIDGTKGFLRGEQFAIAIALLVGGQLMAAALACPMLSFDAGQPEEAPGLLAWARRGQGATLERLAGGGARRLRVSEASQPRVARVVESVESGHTDHGFSAAVLSEAGVGGQPVRMDSQAKYAAVADGRAEIYIRHSQGEGYQEKVWDHAAGALIVAEAGGQVTDLQGRPLDFSTGERLEANHGILATNGLLHETLLDAIRAQG